MSQKKIRSWAVYQRRKALYHQSRRVIRIYLNPREVVFIGSDIDLEEVNIINSECRGLYENDSPRASFWVDSNPACKMFLCLPKEMRLAPGCGLFLFILGRVGTRFPELIKIALVISLSLLSASGYVIF